MRDFIERVVYFVGFFACVFLLLISVGLMSMASGQERPSYQVGDWVNVRTFCFEEEDAQAVAQAVVNDGSEGIHIVIQDLESSCYYATPSFNTRLESVNEFEVLIADGRTLTFATATYPSGHLIWIWRLYGVIKSDLFI